MESGKPTCVRIEDVQVSLELGVEGARAKCVSHIAPSRSGSDPNFRMSVSASHQAIILRLANLSISPTLRMLPRIDCPLCMPGFVSS